MSPGVGADGTYDGIAFADIPIDKVVCSEKVAEHLRSRTRRKGSSNEVDLQPTWAIEAALAGADCR